MSDSRAPSLFFNGRILTGEHLLTASPRIVSALLVESGRVVAAGDAQELLALAPSHTRPIDLGGAFAMPGFNDAHLHLGEGARQRREIDLAGSRSLDQMLARIHAATQHAAPEAWLTGGGWDETLWPEQALPTRQQLDPVTGSRPAVFARIDVHLAVANSAALAIGGITRTTQAPAGSAIDRDDAGEPTGILREQAARHLVERHIPVASPAVRRQALCQVLAEALACGITSVQDNSIDEDFAALCQLHAAGRLPVRVAEWLPFDASPAQLSERRDRAPQDRFLRTTMLKAFLDGSLGSRTAAMLAPYADAPGSTGIPLYEGERLNRMAVERAAAGFELGFHAIGDHALALALAAFAAVKADQPGRAHRFRIEHAQTAAADAFAQAASLGVIASMQPGHLLTDARWVGQRLGPVRSAYAYGWRSFLSAGVPLAFGTDFPVEPLSPFRGLYAALTRQDESGGAAFFPEQRLSLPEALTASTWGPAYAESAESWKGLLCPGYVADLVVLDRDLLAQAGDPRAVLETNVLRTIVDGETAYLAPGQADR